MKILEGKSVFSGIAIGRISVFQKADTCCIKRKHVESAEREIARMETAKEKALTQLEALYDKAFKEAGESGAAILRYIR